MSKIMVKVNRMKEELQQQDFCLQYINWQKDQLKEECHFDCRCCATAAAHMYEGESAFQSAMEKLLTQHAGWRQYLILRVKWFDGKLAQKDPIEVQVPWGSIIYKCKNENGVEVGSIMVVAWRGSTTPLDWAANAASTPAFTALWGKHWPHIEVHSEYGALTYNTFAHHLGLVPKKDGESTIQELILEYDVKKILFTGHSLGGGLAQISLLGALAAVRDLGQEYRDLKLKAFTFAAPMPFHFLDEDLNKDEREVLEEFQKVSYNLVFYLDFIPHLPGGTQWLAEFRPDLLNAVDDEVKKAVEKKTLGKLLEKFIPFDRAHEKVMEVVSPVIQSFSNFKNLGTTIQIEIENDDDPMKVASVSSQFLTPDEFKRQRYPFAKRMSSRPHSDFKELLLRPAHAFLPDVAVHKPAAPMHYYYWRCYGYNSPCLIRCSEDEYCQHKDTFTFSWHESWSHSGYYYWDKEADSHGKFVWKEKTIVRPDCTYSWDTYWYGYFRSSKIDASGGFAVRVHDLQESHLPILAHAQDPAQAIQSLALVANSRRQASKKAQVARLSPKDVDELRQITGRISKDLSRALVTDSKYLRRR